MSVSSPVSSTIPADPSFSRRLIDWQRRCGRHQLPWQSTRDAYRVWLSEIMLQQTQVSTVIPYFARFIERFPTVDALARVPVESVLENWSGLGYYARARNLHRCAQTVVERYDGQFPQDPEVLASLPGIGRSTAAAIAVFAFGVRAAILDGNVKRVFARHFGIAGFPGAPAIERSLWALAESLLPGDGIEAYTQGLMDLGATLCVRSTPDCAACPLNASCRALAQGRVDELPEARPRKPLPERETTMWLLSDGENVLLEQRPATGIWGGLLSLPEQDGWNSAEALAARCGYRLVSQQALPDLRHTFTHFRLLMHVSFCCVEALPPSGRLPEPLLWRPWSALASAALPAPIRKILEAAASR
ncbi:A/G-specific adenine glycosylase [Propionivibrio dicarboxylicus]|uniref:Adenine DNA glycosylase n=1 Tax=Propionivibrio dicarboxylicus TaxID=83767 RepID=A0A1G7WDX3_9RHOO|nr:A/G-specific adenine glycosylase [Propionivibrio dicarboxylicus]SDG70136.1 A/G-specific DNA-adenine glycosylase [Propionivibrio dicarboxylicus]